MPKDTDLEMQAEAKFAVLQGAAALGQCAGCVQRWR